MEVVKLRKACERREGGRRTSAERAGIGHAVRAPGGASDAAARFRPSLETPYAGFECPPTAASPASLLNEMAVRAHIGAMAAARLAVVVEGLELPAGRGHRRQGHVERFPELCRRPHSSNGAPLGEVGRSAVA